MNTENKAVPKSLNEINRDLNKQVAELLGWTQIFHVKGNPGALIGRPPGGGKLEHRWECKIPDWAGDFNACCELGLEYRFTPHQASIESFMYHLREEHGIELDFKTAYRHFMVKKVIDRLIEDKEKAEKYHPAMAA